MNTVSVVMLKSELSRFLESARKGVEVVVTAHRHPVARLVPYREGSRLDIARPTRGASALRRIHGVTPLRAFDPVKILLADRQRR